MSYLCISNLLYDVTAGLLFEHFDFADTFFPKLTYLVVPE